MDTIMIIRDSVATCVKGTAEICQACVKEAETTWQDVAIALLICLTLCFIVRYVIYKYYQCKEEERKASADAAKKERDNDVEDRKWKQKADMKSDLLSFLKERTNTTEGDVKIYDNDRCTEYTTKLDNFINPPIQTTIEDGKD